jgi:hypothetical protein
MQVRAKFMLQTMTKTGYGQGFRRVFTFAPQYDPEIPEDQRFAKASPTGELKITVDNLAVAEVWEKAIGTQFYLDFTPVD